MAQLLGSDLIAIQRVEGIALTDVAQVYSVSISDLSIGLDDLFVKIEGDEMSGPLIINDNTASDAIVFDVKGENNDDPDGSIFIVRKDNVRDSAFYLTTLDMLSNPYEVANKKYVDSKTGGAIRYEYTAPIPPLFSPIEGDIWIDKNSLMMYVYDQAVDGAGNPETAALYERNVRGTAFGVPYGGTAASKHGARHQPDGVDLLKTGEPVRTG